MIRPTLPPRPALGAKPEQRLPRGRVRGVGRPVGLGQQMKHELAEIIAAEDNFAAGFISGCLESRRGIGFSERHARAQCVCTVSEFRASLSEDEFRVLRTFNTLSDDLLVRLGRSTVECETVGTYDTVTGRPDSQLLPARRFERFSIRLPQGFIPNLGRDPDGEPAYMFFRFHADLETSATINGGLIPIVDTRLKGKMLVLRRLPSTSCRR
jgi:hypothetical protein